MLLSSPIITLRPATLREKPKIFEWMAHSNLTSEMLGLPTFPDNPIPTWQEFDEDYTDNYFDDLTPLQGRCFVIEHAGIEIGQINYNTIESKCTEVDIWLSDKKHTGKGWGTEAIRLLCDYLFEAFDVEKIVIQPSKRNLHAIKAYQKAGFKETKHIPHNFVLDYFDSIVLEKMKPSLYI